VPSLSVEGVEVRYGARVAVAGVWLELGAGEMLGLVGESGCGKTSLARAIVGLEPLRAGRVLLDGAPLPRGRVQLVFQDPESALSPRLTVGQTLAEPLRLAGVRDRRERVAELLELVGLPAAFAERPPRALSGGQRQRVGIARALASEPSVLVCDEPVSALDASVRAQVMNVLLDLRDRLGLSCLFISHDLALVRQACERIAVMHQGRIVEQGPSDVVVNARSRGSHRSVTSLRSAASRVPAVKRRREPT